MARRGAFGRLPGFARVHIGQSVVTIAGQPLGTVHDLAGNSFLLKRPADDLWLSRESIFTSDAQGITLICDGHGLLRYAVDPDGIPLRGRKLTVKEALRAGGSTDAINAPRRFD